MDGEDKLTPQVMGENQDPSIEAEPVKPRRGWVEGDEEEKRSGSLELARMSGEKEKEVKRNDVDAENKKTKKKRKRGSGEETRGGGRLRQGQSSSGKRKDGGEMSRLARR